MARGRRAVLLLGFALLLGALAASDVASREARLRDALAPLADVLVARERIAAGAIVSADRLAVRQVPARYAPVGAISDPAAVTGQRAAVVIGAGADITASQLAAPAAAPELRPGQRIVDLVAAGSARLVTAGSRADVLVTREGGSTRLALEGVVVVAATRAPPDPSSGLPRVQASLLVSVRQAVYLTEAQAFAREIRLLPRGEN
jgi:pilus assembly protein CpaB